MVRGCSTLAAQLADATAAINEAVMSAVGLTGRNLTAADWGGGLSVAQRV